METAKNSPLKIVFTGLKLLLICAVVAAVVSFVYMVTEEPYAENMREEKRLAITQIFHPDITYTDMQSDLQSEVPLYVVKEGDTTVGYCVEITTPGYGGDMQIMVGYGTDLKICGVSIVSHNETPGLGDKIKVDENYTKQYEGKGGKLALGTDIDAISGATYSSRYLLEGVNKATATLEKYASALVGGDTNE